MTQLMSTRGEQSNDWEASAADVRWNIQPFIDGAYRRSHASEVVENVNPATEMPLCEMAVGDARDVNEAVEVARRRFEESSWAGMAPTRRGEVLVRLAELIGRNKDELALYDSLEMGKPITAALYDAGEYAPMLLRSWAGFSDKLLGSSVPLTPGSLSMNVYEPRGVVGAISPWNFPAVNAVFKIGPSLAAGNSVVLKPSELAPSSALRIAELALEAGVPEGVLNVVPGLGPTAGAALAEHPDVDMLSFTGSTRTGRAIMELAGRSNGKPMLMECGGKSAHVVFDDLEDLNVVADAVAQDFLWNQGQVCTAHSRLIVHEAVKDELLDRVVDRAARVQFADPLDESTTFGPLASPNQRDRVKAYIDAGVEAGAKPVLMGSVQESEGCYVSPTVFDGVDGSMSIAREEIFGPVLCVQAFENEREAISLANGTEFGLMSTAWTRDIGRGARMARAIRAGAVFVRSSTLAPPLEIDSSLPCEPQRASGFGAEFGLRGLESYSSLKLVSLNGTTS